MKADPVAGHLPLQRTRSSAAHRPVPKRSEVFESVDLAELRQMRKGLNAEESRVSYWRRILQARLDLLRSKDDPSVQLARLARILADARASHRRVAALSVEPMTDLEPLPDLAELWERLVDNDDTAGKQELIDNLQNAETRLSEYRHHLHELIDRVTMELIARYRENQDLALTALNERLIRH